MKGHGLMQIQLIHFRSIAVVCVSCHLLMQVHKFGRLEAPHSAPTCVSAQRFQRGENPLLPLDVGLAAKFVLPKVLVISSKPPVWSPF